MDRGAVVLGVDGGTRNCGWAVLVNGKVVAGSVIRTKRDWHLGCWADATRVSEHISTHLGLMVQAFSVGVLAMEEFSPVRNAGVASRLAMVYGATVREASRLGANVCTRSAKDVRAVLGVSGADKDSLREATLAHTPSAKAYGDVIPPSHQQHFYDAVACATAYVKRGA